MNSSIPHSQDDIIIILTTVPDIKVGKQIASMLVEQELAACVNLLPGIVSIYKWEGNIEQASEMQLFIKTTRIMFNRIKETIDAHHPYDIPELFSMKVDEVSEPYSSWLKQCLDSSQN